MVNAHSLFRSLVIYSVCLPLAIFLGYQLATPLDYTALSSFAILFMVLMFPIMLKWHYGLLIFCWNGVAGFYFLPGKPSLALILIFVSATISFLNYILNRNLKFVSVPTMTWPLLFLTAVVLVTAKLTGGGLNAFGASAVGGKRYLFLLSGVVGYFALTARAIPLAKADFYIRLYFGGAVTSFVGNLVTVLSPSLYFIFWFFPAETDLLAPTALVGDSGITRLAGLSFASMTIMAYMLARYGLKNIFSSRHVWRAPLFFVLIAADMYGGYRARVIHLILLIGVLFVLEGLYRSRSLPILILSILLIGTVTIPFADRLPITIQRSLTFLPLKLDPVAESNARGSSEWRLQMWHEVIPLIPQYFFLGKGYTIDAHDMELFESGTVRGEGEFETAALAGDYHNGPLSVIIPFGIFGVIAFLWFLLAALKVLYRNYLFGDPSLILINRFLFAAFMVKIVLFFCVFGSFYSDMVDFAGPLGLSVALNGGMARRVVAPIASQFFKRRLDLADPEATAAPARSAQ